MVWIKCGFTYFVSLIAKSFFYTGVCNSHRFFALIRLKFVPGTVDL